MDSILWPFLLFLCYLPWLHIVPLDSLTFFSDQSSHMTLYIFIPSRTPLTIENRDIVVILSQFWFSSCEKGQNEFVPHGPIKIHESWVHLEPCTVTDGITLKFLCSTCCYSLSIQGDLWWSQSRWKWPAESFPSSVMLRLLGICCGTSHHRAVAATVEKQAVSAANHHGLTWLTWILKVSSPQGQGKAWLL